MSKKDRLAKRQKKIEEELVLTQIIPRKILGYGSLFVFSMTLLIYVRTLYPSLAGGDSCELTAVVCNLGVAHPPGYPLFTMLGKLFTLLPFNTIAWRVNLLSAVCGSLAAAFLFLTTALWSSNLFAAGLAAALFAFSPVVWTYSTSAEVFALNNLFVTVSLLLCVLATQVRPREKDASGAALNSPGAHRRWAYVGAFWLGLGLSHHHSLIFCVVFLGLGILVVQWRHLKNPRTLLQLCLLFFLGFLPYLYLPWASSKVPLVAWGDQTTWDGFLTHFFRKEYGTFQLGNFVNNPALDPNSTLLRHFLFYVSHIPSEFCYVGLPLALVGLWEGYKTPARKALTLIFAASFFGYILTYCGLSNITLASPLPISVESRFWQQANIYIALWIGMGFAWVVQKLPRNKTAISLILALGLVGFQIGFHFKSHDSSKNTVVRDGAAAVLNSLPQGSILLSKGDGTTPANWYLQNCEGVRPDVRVMDRNFLTYPWEKRKIQTHFPDVVLPGNGYYGVRGFSLKDFYEANSATHPIFITDKEDFWDKSLDANHRTYSVGVVQQIKAKSEPLDFESWRSTFDRMITPSQPFANTPYVNGTWEYLEKERVWEAKKRFAEELLFYAIENQNHVEALKTSIGYYEQRASFGVTPLQANDLKNIGLAYHHLSTTDPTASARMVFWWKLYVASEMGKNDPQLSTILAKMGQSR